MSAPWPFLWTLDQKTGRWVENKPPANAPQPTLPQGLPEAPF